MTTASDSTLFGLPRGFDREELRRIEDFLREAWVTQHGHPPATLAGDLERLKPLFKTNASAKRLRDVATDLKAIRARAPESLGAAFVRIDEHRGLVTPEGRILLDELERLRLADELVLSRAAVARASARAAEVYGTWQRDWLTGQLRGGDLRPGTYGFVLFLLVNGCVSRESGLPMPAEDTQELQLAEIVAPVIDAFATGLGGAAMKPREAQRLRSNWRVTEASRQLFTHVHRANDDLVAYFWAADEDGLVTVLASRLAARQDLTLDRLEAALTSTERAYSDVRSRLNALGLAHDRRSRTERIFNRLIEEFEARREVV
ncbi:MAG: hypothetical protein J7513_16960 [Solirubrobacteraceae bacterium]|nr:hypothetical protein [Solirubrobacteraceae bacterium]